MTETTTPTDKHKYHEYLPHKIFMSLRKYLILYNISFKTTESVIHLPVSEYRGTYMAMHTYFITRLMPLTVHMIQHCLEEYK